MRHKATFPLAVYALIGLALLVRLGSSTEEQGNAQAHDPEEKLTRNDHQTDAHARRMIAEGRQIFRFDTFGSEAFFGDALQLHQAIAGEKNGGVGAGVSPKTALAVGLKVDVDALPAALVAQIRAGKVNLDDPATTLALLKLNAVVGLTGKFDNSGRIRSLGTQCAFCHSNVDDSFAPGIGKRQRDCNRETRPVKVVAYGPRARHAVCG